MKSKLALVLGLVELLTLGTAVLLYFGARRFEDDARFMRDANRDLRERLALSLSAHAYTDALGRSLSQQTPLGDGASRRASDALAAASRLRITGALVACVSPLFALCAALWVSRALAATQASLLEKNERLEEAYRLQGEFVSNVTHELRSPLHSIRGYLEFVLEDEPGIGEQSKKHLYNIGEGAKRLLRLVNDILDFSKLEARQLQIENCRFELNPLLEEALFDARALIAGRPVDLVLEAPETPLFLDSDYTRLRQILTNLLSNAVKFTERGRVTLRVDVHPERVELSVKDTGLGIPAAQLEVIFEPFKQVTPVNGGKAKGGTGLGLAIVARLATLIEASIRVKSELGKGSEFTLVMPRRTLLLT